MALHMIPKDQFQQLLQHWQKQCTHCICSEGDHSRAENNDQGECVFHYLLSPSALRDALVCGSLVKQVIKIYLHTHKFYTDNGVLSAS
jgi:hypothetical protein